MKSRVYIVDDHSLVREGLRSVISAEENLEICGEAEDSRVALSQVMKLRPEVALIDISLKGNSGLELIKSIKAFDAGIHIIVLSMHH